MYSLSVFALAKSLQLILEISATYRLVSYLLADTWLICRLRAQCMISKSNVKSVPYDGVFVVIYSKTMYNKTIIIRFGFCNIWNNQGPRPSPRPITLTSTLIFPNITKTYPIIVYNHILNRCWWISAKMITALGIPRYGCQLSRIMSVSLLQTKHVNLVHQGQFLMPNSQSQMICSLTHD